MKSRARDPVRVAGIMIAICLLFLTGCTSVDALPQPSQEPTSTDVGLAVAPAVATDTSAPEPVETSGLENSPQPAATETQAAPGETTPLPTPRQNLEATDPSTVKLDSGQVQLVEFFAFW